MSGRIRSIKPEWLEDEALAMASSDARVLSVALLLLADDYGNGRANCVQLCGSVFPAKIRDVPAKALECVSNALEELVRSRFVVLYEVDGQHYFHIRTWSRHQKVDKPGRPRVPEFSAKFATVAKVREDTSKARVKLATDQDHDHDLDQDLDQEPSSSACASAHAREGGGTAAGTELDDPEPAPACPMEPVRGVAATRVPTQTRNRATAPSTARREASATATVGEPWLQRPPSSLDEALGWPLRERAQSCLQFAHAADWSCPQQWPEVRAVEERFSETLRRTRVPLGAPSRDSGVRAVLGLFADGVELEPLLEAIGRAGTDDWLRQGRKGLSSLTIEVYRRLASGPAKPERAETAAEMLKRLKAEGRAANASDGR